MDTREAVVAKLQQLPKPLLEKVDEFVDFFNVFHTNAPETYDRILFKTKCDTVFDLIYTYASKKQKWAI